MLKRLPIPFIYILLFGVLLGLVLGFKSFIPYLYWGEAADYEWQRYALPHIINYLFWPLLVPFVYHAFLLFKLSKGSPIRDKVMLIGVSLLIPFVHESATTVIYFFALEQLQFFEFTNETWQMVKAAFPSVYIGRIVEFWIIYGLFTALDYYRKYKDKQSEVARIEAQLNRTKLSVLKMQLQPHFLFNALNSISGLMDIDVKRAQLVTARLGDLLRGILEQDERIYTSLQEELEHVTNYLDIEKIRFEDRLAIILDVEEQLLQARVPSMLIQPLAENAIKHGIAKTSNPGKLSISAKQLNGSKRMIISVSDNGVGGAQSTDRLFKKGIGLRNVKERLEELYPGDHNLVIDTQKGRGFSLSIELPITNYHEKHPSNHSR